MASQARLAAGFGYSVVQLENEEFDADGDFTSTGFGARALFQFDSGLRFGLGLETAETKTEIETPTEFLASTNDSDTISLTLGWRLPLSFSGRFATAEVTLIDSSPDGGSSAKGEVFSVGYENVKPHGRTELRLNIESIEEASAVNLSGYWTNRLGNNSNDPLFLFIGANIGRSEQDALEADGLAYGVRVGFEYLLEF